MSYQLVIAEKPSVARSIAGVIGVGKGNKVADTPAHQIAVSLEIAVLFLIRADHTRNTAGHARFLCNH